MKTHSYLFPLFGSLWISQPCFAVSATWNGSTNAQWATVSNWSGNPNPVPSAGQTATFDNAGNGRTTLDLGVSIAVSQWIFNTANTAAYTLGSGAIDSQSINLDLTGATLSIASNVANDQTFNARVVLGTGAASLSALTISQQSAAQTLTFNGTLQGGTGGTAGNKAVVVSGAGNVNFSNIVKGGAARVQLTYTGSGTMTLGGSGDNTATTCAINSSIGGVVVLNKPSSASIRALNPTNGTILTNGTLRLAGTGGDQLPNSLPLAADGGFFDLNDRSETISGLNSTSTASTVVNHGSATSILTIGHATTDYAFAGKIKDRQSGGTGRMGITKILANSQTLSGANTYTGDTSVQAGELLISSAQAGAGSFQVSDGATLIVQQDAVVTSLATSNFTLGSSSGAVLRLALSAGNPNGPVVTTGALTLRGANVISIDAATLPIGQFPVIQYTSQAGSGNLSAAVSNLPAGRVASLVNHPATSSYDLVIGLVPSSVEVSSFDAWPNSWVQNTGAYSIDPSGGLVGGQGLSLTNASAIAYTGEYLAGGLNGSTGLSGINGNTGIVAVGTFFKIPSALPTRINSPGSDSLIQLGLNLGPAGASFTGLPQLDLRYQSASQFQLWDSLSSTGSRLFQLTPDAWYHLQFVATNDGYVAELHEATHTGKIGKEIASLDATVNDYTSSPANLANYGGIRSHYPTGTVVIDDFRVSDQGNARKATQLLKETPNILVIYVDDLGFNDLGCYAYPGNIAAGAQPAPYPEAKAYAAPNQAVATINGVQVSLTPNIDRLAAQGVKLTNYHAPAPVCTPSRGGFLTGTMPSRLGFSGAIQIADTYGLRTREITLPEALKGNGYATGMVGKWHLGNQPQHLPLRHGFDRFWGLTSSNNQTPGLYDQDTLIDTITDNNQADLLERLTEKMVNFIEKEQTRPFFAWFTPHAPHAPMIAHPDFVGSSTALLGNRQYMKGNRTTQTNSLATSPFHDVVHELDFRVGQILTKLEQLGLAENTLVLFTSDNGPWYGVANTNGPGGDIGTGFPYRGGKFDYWEGGTRVPAIIRFPGQVPAGVVSGGLVSGVDWFKTFVNLGKGTIPADRTLDGEDLMPFFKGLPNSVSPRSYYFHVSNTPGIVRAVTDGISKKFSVSTNNGVLADLRTDFTEELNVQASYPSIVAEYNQQIITTDYSLTIDNRGSDALTTQGIVVNTSSSPFVEVNEGSTASILVSLQVAPAANVTLNLRKRSGSPGLSISPSTLSFTPTNWNTPQNVTIQAVADTDDTTGYAAFEIEGAAIPMREIFARSNDITPASFDSWAADPARGFAPGIVDPLANPDGDGFNNLLEYVFYNREPNVPENAVQPLTQADGSFSFSLNSGVGSLTRRFETSETLAPNSWIPVPDAWRRLSIGGDKEEIHTIQLPTTTTKRFLRLHVETENP